MHRGCCHTGVHAVLLVQIHQLLELFDCVVVELLRWLVGRNFVGAAKQMHTVLDSWCTGCELCIAPCPVDCITMVKAVPEHIWNDTDAALARTRYETRNERLARDKREREARLATKSSSSQRAAGAQLTEAEAQKKAIIAAAIERARKQREATEPKNTAPASDDVRRQIEAADARRARLKGRP